MTFYIKLHSQNFIDFIYEMDMEFQLLKKSKLKLEK